MADERLMHSVSTALEKLHKANELSSGRMVSMKIIERGTIKVVPGKMKEAMGLLKQDYAISDSWGCPPTRMYRCISGKGEYYHTLIVENEWNSLAELEAFLEKITEDPEMRAVQAELENVLVSQEVELFTPI